MNSTQRTPGRMFSSKFNLTKKIKTTLPDQTFLLTYLQNNTNCCETKFVFY